jgi:hypothetical protein
MPGARFSGLDGLCDSSSPDFLTEGGEYSQLLFGAACSTTKRRVPHPLRFLQRVGYATVGIGIRGIPPFAKSAKDGAPGDLLHSLPKPSADLLRYPKAASPLSS